MKYRLIVAEKASVARSIADLLGAKVKKEGYLEGNDHIVSWCAGHLLGLVQADAYDEKYGKWRYADLPIIPKAWKHEAAKDKAKQLKVLAALMNRADVDTVVNACDAGREGELIFRLVYEHAKCRLPVKRLWISSMEDAAIRNGLDNMKDGTAYDSLRDAALCREKADWLVGINMTRLFSVLYGATLNTGRVQSPTLAMLVEREAAIAAFVKEPFYTPVMDCGQRGAAPICTAAGDKTGDRDAAEAIRSATDGQTATVTSIEKRSKSAAPPKLYDLTTLQREANRLYGYTAQQTLDYAQALYEKKLATYPRTDSRYLTEDMAAGLAPLVTSVAAALPFVGAEQPLVNAGAVVDSSKVSDHHAIIPTLSITKNAVFALPESERNLLYMLAVRLLCAVGEKHVYEETAVTLECRGHEFHVKGRSVVSKGWKHYEQLFRDQIKNRQDEDADETEPMLPAIAKGQTFNGVRAAVKEGFTSPPRRYTEDTLLAAMESAGAQETEDGTERQTASVRKGLGTPATRAAVLEKLIKTGFAERDKKTLVSTGKGKNLIAVLPDTLKSPLLTAEWENMLLRVERGEASGDTFLEGISRMTEDIVRANNAPKPEYAGLFAVDAPKKSAPPIGSCPRCSAPVREGARGFFCDARNCGFKIWKENRFFAAKRKTLSAMLVAALLKEGRCAMTGLYSEKTGKTYDAVVVMEDTGQYVNFKLDFGQQKGGRHEN